MEGRVPVRKLNLGGDRQADLTVHGGEQKAVYCYPSEHYGYWKRLLRCRLRGIRCDAAAPALLQTGIKVTARDSNAVCHF